MPSAVRGGGSIGSKGSKDGRGAVAAEWIVNVSARPVSAGSVIAGQCKQTQSGQVGS